MRPTALSKHEASAGWRPECAIYSITASGRMGRDAKSKNHDHRTPRPPRSETTSSGLLGNRGFTLRGPHPRPPGANDSGRRDRPTSCYISTPTSVCSLCLLSGPLTLVCTIPCSLRPCSSRYSHCWNSSFSPRIHSALCTRITHPSSARWFLRVDDCIIRSTLSQD